MAHTLRSYFEGGYSMFLWEVPEVKKKYSDLVTAPNEKFCLVTNVPHSVPESWWSHSFTSESNRVADLYHRNFIH